MSKKKRDAAVPTEESASAEINHAASANPASPDNEVATPLLAEVQSFLSKRDELARKLAEEIAATEAKLAELKRTAASLFPETAITTANTAGKDKKSKRLPRAKPLPSKAEVAGTAEGIAVETAAADSAAVVDHSTTVDNG